MTSAPRGGIAAPGHEIISAAAECGPLVAAGVDLKKDYPLRRGGGVVHAVRDVSLGLYAGGVVALVGESGSGKSTLAKCFAGQESLTSGIIELDGEPVQLRSRGAFRRYKEEVQYVFQDPFASLNPVHTVQYTLSQPVRLHQGRQSRTGRRASVIDLLERVHLTPGDQYLAKYPHELSGGQRQRVSFARALAVRPRVLLADEPVSMLDVSIRLEMLNLLSDLCRNLRLALLYITHDIASARYFADEILVMYGGEVVERGPAEQLTQNASHPYTQLLVASAPDPESPHSTLRREGRAVRQAVVPVRSDSAIGCAFSGRCPLAEPRCWRERPPVRRISSTHTASCWAVDGEGTELKGGRQ